MTDAPDAVSVVIVNFNAGDYLARAIDSVRAQSAAVSEIIVVDNGSTDASLALLAERVDDPRLRVIGLGKNYGFAHACNLGTAAASGATILFLNPDCRMFPGSLAALTFALAERPAAAMVGPLLLNPDGAEQRGGRRDIPNPWQIFCYMLGLHRLMPHHPRFRSFNKLADPLPAGPTDVPAISGACMLVRREFIERVGPLDDATFFMHFEDLDWCLRATQAGRAVIFAPAALVEHTQGVCSASRPFLVEYHKHLSLVRFLAKHFSRFYPKPFMTAVRALVYAHLTLRMLSVAVQGAGLIGRRRGSIRSGEAAVQQNHR